MYTIHPQGEVRPIDTAESGPSDFQPPLDRLRGRERRVITPEKCLVRHCPICQWRREGLLDAPVVREVGLYSTACSHCAYLLGREHGAADGPQNRPTLDWLDEAGLNADAYLRGYDEACRARLSLTSGSPLWDATDACLDGLPF